MSHATQGRISGETKFLKSLCRYICPALFRDQINTRKVECWKKEFAKVKQKKKQNVVCSQDFVIIVYSVAWNVLRIIKKAAKRTISYLKQKRTVGRLSRMKEATPSQFSLKRGNISSVDAWCTAGVRFGLWIATYRNGCQFKKRIRPYLIFSFKIYCEKNVFMRFFLYSIIN